MSEHTLAQRQKSNTAKETKGDDVSLQHRDTDQLEPNAFKGSLFDAGSETFLESRFGYDFSGVPAFTGMVRQTQPLLSTQPMVQRSPKDGTVGSSSCPNCPEAEIDRISSPGEPTTETAPSTETTEPMTEPPNPGPEVTPTPTDQVTEPSAPGETTASALIVEDSAADLSEGQMRKSEFLSQLRTEVFRTTETAIAGSGQATECCPYICNWFDIYGGQDSAHIERAIRGSAPEASSITTASEYISLITHRACQSAETWARTGKITGVPKGVPIMLPEVPAESGKGGETQTGSVMFKAREGGARAAENPLAIQRELGKGRPMDSGVRSRMESAFGMDFARVRTHTDTTAAGLSTRMNARAFTVGEHVAFGAGEYQPGTLVGDALIAHELAHVIQQGGGTDSAVQKIGGVSSYNNLEEDADKSAVGAIVSLWSGTKHALTDIAQNAIPRLSSGLRLQRCGNKTPDGVPLGPTDETKAFCLKPASFTVTTGIDSNTASAAQGRQDMKFEGLNTGNQGGKTCSCGCGLYRHWIKGYWRSGSATAAKKHDISSCGNNLTINESTFTEEYTSCIGDNDPDPCKFAYADAPGLTGLSDGTYAELQYTFKYQVWDTCQGKSVATAPEKTLNISGDKAPRVITWT